MISINLLVNQSLIQTITKESKGMSSKGREECQFGSSLLDAIQHTSFAAFAIWLDGIPACGTTAVSTSHKSAPQPHKAMVEAGKSEVSGQQSSLRSMRQHRVSACGPLQGVDETRVS